jgi:hypothetical protein
MKTLRYLLFPAFALLLAACQSENSDDVNQDKIWAEYELFYNSNTDITYAKATFKFSNALGTNLQLTAPSTVTFNGQTLVYKSVLAYYEKEFAGLVTSGTFVWTDLNGNTFTNSIDTVRTIAFEPGFTSVTRGSSNNFSWEGPALISGEAAILSITNVGVLNTQIFTQTGAGSTSMVLEANKLNNLSPGNQATAILDRTHSQTPAQITSAGGNLKTTYRALNKTIMVN